MQIVLLKAVCCAVLLAAMAVIRRPGVQTLTGRSLAGAVLGGWTVFRAAPFVLVYLVAGFHPPSDVTGYFWPQALSAASGGIVYRDFPSHYAPLFSYVLAAGVRLWHSPLAIVLIMMVVELAAVWVTARLFARTWPRDHAKVASWLYFASPAPFVLVVLGGQEDVWLWLAGALLVSAGSSGGRTLAGAAGLLLTKPLFLFPLGWVMFRRPADRAYIAAILVFVTGTAVTMWMVAGPGMLGVLREGNELSPPNVWLMLDLLTGGAVTRVGVPVLSAVGLTATFAIGAALFRRLPSAASINETAAVWIAGFAVLMLLSPKSLGNYAAFLLLPLTFLAARGAGPLDGVLLVLLNVTAAIQPSMWYRLGAPHRVGLADIGSALDAIELTMEVVMMAALGLIAWRAAGRVTTETREPMVRRAA